MKPIAWVYAAFITTFGAMNAQAPVQEWRPSLAEDNKAATWTDTADFLTHEMKVRHWEQPAPRYADPRSHFIDVIDASVPSSCHLDLKYRAIYEHSPGFTTQSDIRFITSRLDFTQIDPLSVLVSPFPLEVPAEKEWVVELSGTNRHDIDHWSSTVFTIHENAEAASRQLQTACSSERHCKADQGSSPKLDFIVTDQELAHRLARAFAHAALLCGGAKSVSPF